VNATLYKLGLRLAQLRYVRNAIDQRADLSEFRKPPTFRIFAGMFLIAFSFVMCWPAIGALSAFAIYHHMYWIAAVGGPTLYILSHLCYIAGMVLSGEKYMRIFFRWLTRRGVERLLALGIDEQRPGA
jgi:hypothetical protein